ncbi:uncharacterized protein A1O5_04413 [Cladophialophora psammophila CBS 110553]|uniref:Clr5 domain-containing protein n=1 Tax=Cladophialophora psammophila CBS 110553 TaxID=1182543 RepID=W9WUQ4_9EURO|nr:uncharacterized protein A1O5_04413 [Cladophialophora psammophila CBS 110553]EXJ71912.1 hypothetical protein A1O5_04413 [Cladophialophora psammophila CBS 110553]
MRVKNGRRSARLSQTSINIKGRSFPRSWRFSDSKGSMLECHYKTYIKKWRLDKKNKQSDIIFAFQKLQERQGKDTAFLIRGQLRSRENVGHYWKRTRLNPARFSPVPHTPDGVEYRTPSPSVGGNSDEAEPEDTRQGAGRSPFAGDEHVTLFQYINQGLALASRSPSLRLLSSPEPLRAQDQALHYAKVLFQTHVERADPNLDTVFLGEVTRFLDKLIARAYSALVAIDQNMSLISIQSRLLDTLELIPGMVKYDCGYVTMSLLRIIVSCGQGTQSWTSTMNRMVSRQIVEKTGNAYGVDHPVSLLLRTLIRSFGGVLATSEMIMLSGKDIMARGLGHDYAGMGELLRCLCDVSVSSGSMNSALKHANELYSMCFCRRRKYMTESSLTSFLLCLSQLAMTHFTFGNYAESDFWIEEGLRTCCQGQSPSKRATARADFLYCRALAMGKHGQWSAAFEVFGEVLRQRMRVYGAGDYAAMQCGEHMQWIRYHHLEKGQHLRAAEGGCQNEGRGDPCAVGQDEPRIDGRREPSVHGEAEPSNNKDFAHLWPNHPEQHPLAIGQVEAWTDEQPQQQQQPETHWDDQLPGLSAGEDQWWRM